MGVQPSEGTPLWTGDSTGSRNASGPCARASGVPLAKKTPPGDVAGEPWSGFVPTTFWAHHSDSLGLHAVRLQTQHAEGWPLRHSHTFGSRAMSGTGHW